MLLFMYCVSLHCRIHIHIDIERMKVFCVSVKIKAVDTSYFQVGAAFPLHQKFRKNQIASHRIASKRIGGGLLPAVAKQNKRN
jgi:hypothetical protein